MKALRQRKPTRRGVSLVETLVIISAASTVLTLTGLLIHRTMQASSRAQAFHSDEANAWRVSAQLRIDTVGAKSAEIRGNSLTLYGHDGTTIRYDGSESGLRRTVSDGESDLASDIYSFRGIKGWSLNETKSPRCLTLVANPPQYDGLGSTGAPLRLRVTVGLPEDSEDQEASP